MTIDVSPYSKSIGDMTIDVSPYGKSLGDMTIDEEGMNSTLIVANRNCYSISSTKRIYNC
jgi:hypothetical protein